MRCMMAGALPLLGIVGARASMLAVVAAHAARAVVSLMKRVCDGTTLEQQLYNLPLVVLCRLHVGRLALLVRQLRVGLGLQQLVDGVRVAHAGGQHQGRVPHVLLHVDLCPGRQERAQDGAPGRVEHGHHERRDASVVRQVHVRAAAEQHLCDLYMVALRRLVQSGVALLRLDVHARAALDQEGQDPDGAALGRSKRCRPALPIDGVRTDVGLQHQTPHD
mmetsp:Transcript_35761/g.85445  ORF Transcript_35761/g.85445 Transcript_35761/m.85445 type:complete len:220 (+) Transcript_35761:270-929(+)